LPVILLSFLLGEMQRLMLRLEYDEGGEKREGHLDFENVVDG
jgi:hypothetical protein